MLRCNALSKLLHPSGNAESSSGRVNRRGDRERGGVQQKRGLKPIWKPKGWRVPIPRSGPHRTAPSIDRSITRDVERGRRPTVRTGATSRSPSFSCDKEWSAGTRSRPPRNTGLRRPRLPEGIAGEAWPAAMSWVSPISGPARAVPRAPVAKASRARQQLHPFAARAPSQARTLSLSRCSRGSSRRGGSRASRDIRDHLWRHGPTR